MIIGICGKSGSGKTTLANQLIEYTNNRTVHLEMDKIGHEVLKLQEVKDDLVKTFGSKVIVNNVVDRKTLGRIVYSSKEEMDKLTDITWGHMQVLIDEFIDNNKDRIILLDWLLLPLSKYFEMCDIRILLDIPYEVRKQRAMLRDNITEEAFLLRDKSSISYNNEDFDVVLKTNNKEEVERKVKLR